MYLVDTNIFLEILLSQDKSGDCKEILTGNINSIFISDFSLHSIGVILFRYRKEAIFNDFIEDVLPRIEVVSLPKEAYRQLSEYRDAYNLDFDDSYQCKLAEERGLMIVTMDKDFERVKDKIGVRFV